MLCLATGPGAGVRGAIAQLAERRFCIPEVRGSTPLGSTADNSRSDVADGGSFGGPRSLFPGSGTHLVQVTGHAAWARAAARPVPPPSRTPRRTTPDNGHAHVLFVICRSDAEALPGPEEAVPAVRAVEDRLRSFRALNRWVSAPAENGTGFNGDSVIARTGIGSGPYVIYATYPWSVVPMAPGVWAAFARAVRRRTCGSAYPSKGVPVEPQWAWPCIRAVSGRRLEVWPLREQRGQCSSWFLLSELITIGVFV